MSENNGTNLTHQSPQMSKPDAYYVTGFSQKDATLLQAPNIENIIEEDENEIEQETPSNDSIKIDEIKVIGKIENEVNSTNSVDASKKNNINSKFKLEPVHLTDLETSTKSSSPTPFPLQASNSKYKINTDNKRVEQGEETNETVEIRVEEGYATRQMDEYFRQTIAAIKEELTKKLETKNDKKGGESKPTDDDYDEDYDSDVISDFGQHYDQAQNNYNYEKHSSKTNQCMCISCCCEPYTERDENYLKNVRSAPPTSSDTTYLYQHYLAATNKKPKRSERFNSWLVLVGCILNHFIIDGLCFNYVNLFDLVQKEFGLTSKLLASLPYTFLIGFYLLIAPVSFFLAKQYGTKRVAILGTFISTFSMLISSFLKDSFILFLIFNGVLTGVGIGFVYVPTVIATSRWFLKNRMFANSFNILSACVGAAVYPLVSDLLLKKYEMFDTLFILSGVQFNCLIGSLLLKSHKSTFLLSKLNAFKRRNNQINYSNLEENNHLKTRSNKSKSMSSTHLLVNEHFKDKTTNDFETVSVANSSSTITNYTLKQYWRKFVQTRKSQANAKKNLFHLIAEEKRKTRTLSKTSLEDGFVITTSNNLLAPNDDAHIIVSRKNARGLEESDQTNSLLSPSNSSRTASRLLTRIANSLRSLTHIGKANTSSPSHTTAHSKLNVKLNDSSENVAKPVIASKSTLLKIPLLNVFNGPIQNGENLDDNARKETDIELNHQVPANLASVFNNDQSNATTITSNITQQTNLDNSSDSDEDLEEEDSATKKANITNKASNQMNRYLSYRSSLTNSIRGSLMELSLPEVKENDNEHDDTKSVEESFSENTTKKNLNSRKIAERPNGLDKNHLTSSGFNKHTKNASLINLKRFISNVDGASFYNSPFNLEPIEFNLRNSLIKKCSDVYRKQQSKLKPNEKRCTSSFFNYLTYLTSVKLLKNSILLMLNVSFLFVIIGMCVPLIYLSEFVLFKSQEKISKTESIYFLSLIGLMIGLGRVVSLTAYRVNESNAKNRIFSYNLTLILSGLTLISSTYLCDTLFSFTVFSTMFGFLLGFNLALRSVVTYDMTGLEWSDDSLFFYVILSQSVGAFIGIPVAGLVFDITKNYETVFQFAGACFIISGLILIPGRNWKTVCINSFKSFNRFYLQRRF